MTVTFDPAKDRANVAKHGVSLSLAEEFDWRFALVVEDTRFDYGERRFRALGPSGGSLYVLVYTPRKRLVRVISLRKATTSEKKQWRKRMR